MSDTPKSTKRTLAIEVVRRLRGAGQTAFWVGGCVRDFLLQREPEDYRSLRVRMGGWCAYFTMLSQEQQEHQIRRQGSR